MNEETSCRAGMPGTYSNTATDCIRCDLPPGHKGDHQNGTRYRYTWPTAAVPAGDVPGQHEEATNDD